MPGSWQSTRRRRLIPGNERIVLPLRERCSKLRGRPIDGLVGEAKNDERVVGPRDQWKQQKRSQPSGLSLEANEANSNSHRHNSSTSESISSNPRSGDRKSIAPGPWVSRSQNVRSRSATDPVAATSFQPVRNRGDGAGKRESRIYLTNSRAFPKFPTHWMGS